MWPMTYSDLFADAYYPFSTSLWTDEDIPTFPFSLRGRATKPPYVLLEVVTSGDGVNFVSKSGLLICSIFTPIVSGPALITEIADKLDTLLAGKTIRSVQFLNSVLGPTNVDPDAPSINRSNLSIPFSFNRSN
jgi:hypothetical protein